MSKFVIFAALTTASMVLTDPLVLAAMLVACVALTLSAGVSRERLVSSLKPLALVMVLLFVFTAFTYDPSLARHDYARTTLLPIWEGGFLSIAVTTGGLLFGLSFVMKILTMMFASVYLIGTTPMEEILAALQKLGLPSAVGLIATVAFRFMPTMLDEVDTIKDAQRARGAGRATGEDKKSKQAVKGTIPLFVPMIVSSMRRSDTMAMSMVSRGFGYSKRRTQMAGVTFTAVDALVTVAVVLALVNLLYLRFTHQFGVL